MLSWCDMVFPAGISALDHRAEKTLLVYSKAFIKHTSCDVSTDIRSSILMSHMYFWICASALTWHTPEIDHSDKLCSWTCKSHRISSASRLLLGKEPLYRNSSDISSSLPLSSFRGCFLFLLLFLPLHNGAPHGNNSLHVRAGPRHSSPVGLIPGNRKGFWQGPLFPECVNEGGRGEGAFGEAKSEGRGQDWAKIKILRALLPHAFYFSLFQGASLSFSGKLSLSF